MLLGTLTLRAEEGVDVDRSETRAACRLYEFAVSRRKMVRQLTPIQGLPKELGVLLVVGGIGGLLLPGPVGTPFLILGGVILWPAAFRRVESCFEKRFPRLHRRA